MKKHPRATNILFSTASVMAEGADKGTVVAVANAGTALKWKEVRLSASRTTADERVENGNERTRGEQQKRNVKTKILN